MRPVAGRVRCAEACSRPPNIPLARPRAQSKRYGLRFEKLVAKATSGRLGVWWKFLDDEGEHYCQTDVLLTYGASGLVYVLECKLTEVAEAQDQLGLLYVPVVTKALGVPAKGIVVARHLTRRSDTSVVCSSLREAMSKASSTSFPTLHWLGKGPI